MSKEPKKSPIYNSFKATITLFSAKAAKSVTFDLASNAECATIDEQADAVRRHLYDALRRLAYGTTAELEAARERLEKQDEALRAAEAEMLRLKSMLETRQVAE